MVYTDQMKALEAVQAIYGTFGVTKDYGWTEDRVGCRRVGCKIGLWRASATGATWDEAIEKLKAKVRA